MSADITIVAAGIVAAAQPGLADEAAMDLPLLSPALAIARADMPPASPMPAIAAELEPVGEPMAATAAPTFSGTAQASGMADDGYKPEHKLLLTPAVGSLAAVEAAETQLIREQRMPERRISEQYSPEQHIAEEYVPKEYVPEEYVPEQPNSEQSVAVQTSAIAPELSGQAETADGTSQEHSSKTVASSQSLNQSEPVATERYWQERALAMERFEARLAHSQAQRPIQSQIQAPTQVQAPDLWPLHSQAPRPGAIAEPAMGLDGRTQIPVQSKVELATNQHRRLSPERQILTQVMLERAEAEFLQETLGLTEPVAAQGSPSSAAAMGSGPVTSIANSATANDIGQLTHVSQLRDVQPTDWAYQAAQSLIERYGCVAGYPDQRFRGDRALSRYEFAAGLNACLERITELLPVVSAGDQANVSGGGFAAQADLAIIQQLSDQFQLELEQLRDRAGRLEQRQAELETQQFSTTTKLYGQTIFGLRGGNNNDVDLFPVDGNPERNGAGDVTFGGSTELTLASSFSGSDLLLTTLQAGNFAPAAPAQFTNMGQLAHEGNTNSQLLLADLSYRFAVTPDLGIIIGTHGISPSNTFRGISPLESSGDGALSRLGQRNPILELGGGRGGAGFDWQMSPSLSLQGVYSAAASNQAGSNLGLFDGGYVAGGQLSAGLGQRVDLGIHYLHAYTPNGALGTGLGDAQVLSPFAPQGSSFHTHAVGATAAWRPSQRLTVGGWGGWTSSRATTLSGRVQTTNWMGFAQVNDLFRQGNALGLLVGQPPKITSSNLPVGFNFPEFSNGGGPGGRRDTALHLEAFYRAQLNDYVSLTPGIVVVRNPNHNVSNETLVVGAMRTTVRF